MLSIHLVLTPLPFNVESLPTADIRSLSFLESLVSIARLMELSQAKYFSIEAFIYEAFVIKLSGLEELKKDEEQSVIETIVSEFGFEPPEKSATRCACQSY
jgi:hypothetical protein